MHITEETYNLICDESQHLERLLEEEVHHDNAAQILSRLREIDKMTKEYEADLVNREWVEADQEESKKRGIMTLGPRQEALLKELETTDKKQGVRYLHRADCFCVEGIICELAIQMGLKLRKTTNGIITFYGSNCGAMPYDVGRYFGFYTGIDLWKLNDYYGLSFKEIASKIRTNSSQYFDKAV